jgi:hypothetical protein
LQGYKKFRLRDFPLDSRYKNLPKERIHRNCALIILPMPPSL